MEQERKDANVQIGKRLKEARNNLGYKQSEFAVNLKVTEEHYRKFESGSTGLSADKILLLYKEYGIDPTYLITGEHIQEFDVESYVANCSKEQRDRFVERVLAYMEKLLKK